MHSAPIGVKGQHAFHLQKLKYSYEMKCSLHEVMLLCRDGECTPKVTLYILLIDIM